MKAWLSHPAVRRWLPWLGFALALAVAPLLAGGGLALGMLTQMGIAIIACLSYNILLGQGGMLSFGHAMYTGLGAYGAIHLLAAAGRGQWPWLAGFPVSLLPLAGGLTGLAVALALGWLGARRGGTSFAMISLALGELVFAAGLMFSGVFGGNAGIQADRVLGAPVLGISFGPAWQVYALTAIYTLACVGLMYAFAGTPLGRLLNAVRDNAERVGFIGFDARRVRYLAVCMAGFFAGVAGGLGALLFEIVTPEVLGPERSGAYLLFTFLGGASVFAGPVLGGVLLVLASVWLSALTPAWLLYLGLLFMLAVMWAPQGLAGLALSGWQGWRAWVRQPAAARTAALRRMGPLALLGGLSALAALLGLVAMVEMLYRLLLADTGLGDTVSLGAVTLHVRQPAHWLLPAALGVLGGAGWWWLRRRRAAGDEAMQGAKA